ncbi:uncharacterized protein [Epargyreus clarus]|uniref:uncharacterized protein n=1 Tax=Epargyreus clarus TaxID=520877 RepID=UPI003C2EADAB
MEDQFKERCMPTSSSFTLNEEKPGIAQLQSTDLYSDINYRLIHPDIPKFPKSGTVRNSSAKSYIEDNNFDDCNESLEPYCHVKLDSIVKLKDSTKKLLCLLEEIQSKTHSKLIKHDEFLTLDHFTKSTPSANTNPVADNISIGVLKKLETQASNLEAIYVQDEDDDCSVYKRLTRKCHCLNQDDYNDLVIHFNEETKYSTSTIGEIIKNMRILKKFLYMGGKYTKHALMFLNEGLSESPHTEKVEITQGCSHSDICNIFDDQSIVMRCISWPCKFDYYGDTFTQALAAGLLNKLAEIEEGRRYLNFSSKITNDIRKVLRKKSAVLEIDTIESLNSTLNLLKPPFVKNSNITYFCKSIYEGFGHKTISDLIKFRQYMTLDEMLTHLDLLRNFSNNDNGKVELTMHLPAILILFKNMLTEFDNSEMNIIITHILNNVVSKNMVKPKEPEKSKIVSIADTATEPIKMKNEVVQIPPKKNHINKKMNKQKLSLGIAPNKNRQPFKQQVSGWEPSNLLNRSKKFTRDLRRSIIVVPIEINETYE